MILLGIDFGKKKIGVSLGSTNTRFAEPHSVIRYQKPEDGIKKVIQLIQVNQVNKIVIGISEGKSEIEAREFGELLEQDSKTEVVFQDETLSTADAQRKSIEAGIGRNKRRGMEDAYAATIILQEYLDTQE